MTIGNYWQAASIFPTMGRKRLQARIFARWHQGSRICRKSGLGLRARGRGSSFLSAWALEEQGGTPEQRPTFIVSPPRYFACQRGCYETTPFSPCRYWPKYILAPGTLRIVFGAWEPWRAPSALPAPWHQPGSCSPGISQKAPGAAPGLLFCWAEAVPHPSGTGGDGGVGAPAPTPARGWWGQRVAMPGGPGGSGERQPPGRQPGALRPMKSIFQARRLDQILSCADGSCWSGLCVVGSSGTRSAPAFS